MLVYIVNWTWPLLFITILLGGLLPVESIKTYAFEDWCGLTVSRQDSVGKLLFNATIFSSFHGNNDQYCRVTLTPAPLPYGSGGGKILFYFEEFDLPGECDEVNVTLLDGASTDSPKVIGAPFPLCGYNYTLTYRPGIVFNTTGDSVTVELRWKDVFTFAWDGFELKYASYYEGSCGEDVVRCQNGRCASKPYHCHDEIDTCGKGEKSACRKLKKEAEDSGWESTVSKIGEYAKYAGGVIGLVIISIYVFKIVRLLRREHGSVTNFVRYKCCGGSRNGQRSRSGSRSLGSVEMGNRGEASEPLNNGGGSTNHVGGAEPTGSEGLAQGPPSYDTLDPSSPVDACSEPQPPGPATPSAPPPNVPPPGGAPGTTPSGAPPSYDDFLSNEDRYQNKH